MEGKLVTGGGEDGERVRGGVGCRGRGRRIGGGGYAVSKWGCTNYLTGGLKFASTLAVCHAPLRPHKGRG